MEAQQSLAAQIAKPCGRHYQPSRQETQYGDMHVPHHPHAWSPTTPTQTPPPPRAQRQAQQATATGDGGKQRRRRRRKTGTTVSCILFASKKENRRCKKRPWVGRCGLTWRGGCLGPGGRGLGGRPRVEAGERRGGSRARTTSRQSQRVLTPRGCGPVGPGQGRTCAHSPTPITESPAQPFSRPTPRH